jgi:hypothetical protein
MLPICGNADVEFCNGAKEGAVMRAVLELLQDYLHTSGLGCLVRSMPMSAAAAQAVRQKSALLLGLCSHTGSGAAICYRPACEDSKRAAQLLCDNISPIAPGAVKIVSTPLPGRCPTLLLRLGCRDNLDEAQWMVQCTGVVAHAMAKAVTSWFGVPCKSPFANCEAAVHTPNGALALRRAPSAEAPLLRALPNGATLLLLHRDGEWQYVECEGSCGYVLRKFLAMKTAAAKK